MADASPKTVLVTGAGGRTGDPPLTILFLFFYESNYLFAGYLDLGLSDFFRLVDF